MARTGSTPKTVESYERESLEVIRRFLARKLTFPQCMQALDGALAELLADLHLNGEPPPSLRALTAANHELVMDEMQRRLSMSPPAPPETQ